MNDKGFEVDEVVVFRPFQGEAVLANLRGWTGVTAILYDEGSGVQGGVPLDRVDHTPLWYALDAARRAGYDEVLLSETGWTPIAAWHERYQQVVGEQLKFERSLPAIVDDVPPGRVQAVFRLRNAKAAYLAEVFAEEMHLDPGDLRARLRAACYDATDDVTRLSWLSALLDLIRTVELPTEDEDAIATCLHEVAALYADLARLLNEIREVKA